jgi:hypothetical protein
MAGHVRFRGNKNDRYVMIVTVGVALWNMGVAYPLGLLLHHAMLDGA